MLMHDEIIILNKIKIKREFFPFALWIIVAIGTWAFFAIIRFFTGEFYSMGEMRGLVADYNTYHQYTIAVPSIVVFYVLLPKFIQDCFVQLIQNGVFAQNLAEREEEDSFAAFLVKMRNTLFSKILVWISFGSATLFISLALPQHIRLKKGWWYVNPPAIKHIIELALEDTFWWVITGLVILLGLRTIVGIWWINQAFKRFSIVMQPWHPDGAGGLSPLSRFSVRLGYIIFFFGLELGMNQMITSYYLTGQWGRLSWTPDILLSWIVYLVVALGAFFAPIVAAHGAMREAKENELKFIAGVLEEEYKSLRQRLGSDLNSIQMHMRKIEELQNLYNMVKSFPVWPFQVQKFAEFFGTILFPLLLTTFSTFITNSISKWVGL